MGQAKLRGNFAERQAAAYTEVEKQIDLQKEMREHIEKLDKVEKTSDQQAVHFACQMIVQHWKHSDISRRMPRFAPLDQACFVVYNNPELFNADGTFISDEVEIVSPPCGWEFAGADDEWNASPTGTPSSRIGGF
jgi:hypothetical protein